VGLESDDADVDEAFYQANERIFEKAGEPAATVALYFILQLRSVASDAPRDASDGSGHRESRLVD
jgi:hypothetical protein